MTNTPDNVLRILILGGTTEARRLAARLAENAALGITLSLAGRTRVPIAHPVPVRVGGFGGVEGLARYLAEKSVHLLIDATHPYAARISTNAVVAAASANVALLRVLRAPWEPVEGDTWQRAESIAQARDLLGNTPRRAFLALGRQELLAFEAAPQHAYVVRSVDPVEPKLDLPQVIYITARGPFALDDEIALLREHRIDSLVSKNSGGQASYGKIVAARMLGLPVVMIERPADIALQGNVGTVHSVDAAVDAVHRGVSGFRKRGV